jgi:serine protease AprX
MDSQSGGQVTSRGKKPRRLTWSLSAGVGALLVTGSVLATAVPASAAPATSSSDRASGSTPTNQSGPPKITQRGKRWHFDDTAVTTADVARVIGADRLYASGITGRGVGVALIDTGVVPVAGLSSGNVVNGPDLSLESQSSDLRYLDTYGHGTHLAGIIAGNDKATGFRGIAPGATLTSLKVAAADGAVDVSQVIAAIDWVVEHRNDDRARPIRVLNLAYGTDSVQSPQVDPLAHAVENAWRAGIVVVAAAGNGGVNAASLTDPATDPYVLAVGSVDLGGTGDKRDDLVSDFSSRGNDTRRVDLVAPGRSIVSLRNPGGSADTEFPSARVGEEYFKGSGTSQSAAVLSGSVALLLQQRPELTPDQVKGLLTDTADRLRRTDAAGQGAGELDLTEASRARVINRSQNWPRSTGTGSLEAARGGAYLTDGDTPLTGENDIFGPFDAKAWAKASTAGTSWNGGRWMGNYWAGDGYDGSSWTSRTWSGHTWSGHTWSGHTWSDASWSDASWSGHTWSDSVWGA